jgi:hypothetical protein
MDLDDFTPAGGGSLRQPLIHNGQSVATFTTPTPHQDEIWSASTMPVDDQDGPAQDETRQQRRARPGRPGNDTGDAFHLQGTSKMIRWALRPGS